jgi:hypothetical protein
MTRPEVNGLFSPNLRRNRRPRRFWNLGYIPIYVDLLEMLGTPASLLRAGGRSTGPIASAQTDTAAQITADA